MKTRNFNPFALTAVAAVGFVLGYLIKDLFLDLLLGGSLF